MNTKWRPWTLRQARALINKLEAELTRVDWHVALAGSVLLRGRSSNDLDLIVYPHTSTKVWRPFADSLRYDLGYEALYRTLVKCGLTQLADAARVKTAWVEGGVKRGPSPDQKWVEVWMYDDDQRVDIFVMR